MRYISADGTDYGSHAESVLHTAKLKIDAAAHGKLSEFEEMMAAERGDDQFSKCRYKDAWVDWATGYVRMYNPHGTEIAAVKIDTEFYRQKNLEYSQR